MLKLLIRCIGIILSVMPMLAFAQSQAETDAMNAVAMISTDTRQLGAGIIVGEDDRWLYLITAHHVVWNPSKKTFAGIDVSFRTMPDKTFEAIPYGDITIPDRYGLDLTILKVERDHFLTDFPLPSAERLFGTEQIDNVTFIGRKSSRATWRSTPSFEVEASAPVDDRHFAAYSFFNLRGFSGGGVFDANMRLAGMAVAGGLEGADFNDDEYTLVLKISAIVEILKQRQIPLAPYLREPAFIDLPPNYQDKIAYAAPSMNSFGLLGRDLDLYLARYSLHGPDEVELMMFVKDDGIWHLWGKDMIATPMQNMRTQSYLLPFTASDIFICVQNQLPGGGYGIVTIDATDLPVAKANDISMDFSPSTNEANAIAISGYKYAPGKTACTRSAQDRKIDEGAFTRKTLGQQYKRLSELYTLWGGSSRALFIEEVNVGIPTGYGRSIGADGKEVLTEVEFDAGTSWYNDDGAGEFTIYYELGFVDGGQRRGHVRQKGESYGHELTIELTDKRPANVNSVKACFVAHVTDNEMIGLTADYQERQLSRVMNETSNKLTATKFIASTHGADLSVTLGSTPSDVCDENILRDSIEVNGE